jgi:hypothetical protein
MKYHYTAFFFTLTLSSLLSAMEEDTIKPFSKDVYDGDTLVYKRSKYLDAAVELYKEIGNNKAWLSLKEEVWNNQLDERSKKENQATKKSIPTKTKPTTTINFEKLHDKDVMFSLLATLQKQFSLNSMDELKQFFYDELKRLVNNTNQEQLLTIQEGNSSLEYKLIDEQNTTLKTTSALFLNKKKAHNSWR